MSESILSEPLVSSLQSIFLSAQISANFSQNTGECTASFKPSFWRITRLGAFAFSTFLAKYAGEYFCIDGNAFSRFARNSAKLL